MRPADDDSIGRIAFRIIAGTALISGAIAIALILVR
ncbi:hypothetical protein BH10PSE14_BH10PSE14_04210 [soil metagenome]